MTLCYQKAPCLPMSNFWSSCERKYKQIFREALKKKLQDYLGIFPNMGGGVFPIPKTQNQKKSAFKSP